ncbi:MAG: hypothetical protein A2172_02285 [Candidatus Woykebacteria bacterium RBG_13_40_15]|uniref:ASCH domain-containing protein n=1 Tax=Candidatus Woykebacteria bacterium RBG_13_40_15 TaxID=1802593 RepID=A0A1G1W6G5_9BACT|nr:MAG: hypothetical protein A2172_02285 [Candidatus Woykebacteria bacterium RBG_13_40_15]
MKTLKFDEKFVGPILAGEKTNTWRLFDEKNLKTGDEIEFINKQTGETFAKAKLTDVFEKPFKDLTPEDFEGHEKFPSEKEMFETYSKYYGKQVSSQTPVKIIHFKLL